MTRCLGLALVASLAIAACGGGDQAAAPPTTTGEAVASAGADADRSGDRSPVEDERAGSGERSHGDDERAGSDDRSDRREGSGREGSSRGSGAGPSGGDRDSSQERDPSRESAPSRGGAKDRLPSPEREREARAFLSDYVARYSKGDASICTEVFTQRHVEALTGRKGEAAVANCRRDVSQVNTTFRLVEVESIDEVDARRLRVVARLAVGERAYRSILELLEEDGRVRIDAAG